MIRSFKPLGGNHNVEFAAPGQDALVTVPAEGLEVETHDADGNEINVDLLSALEENENVQEGDSQPDLFAPPVEPVVPTEHHDGDPEE